MEGYSLESEREKRLAASVGVSKPSKVTIYPPDMSAEDIAREEVKNSIMSLIEIRDDEELPAGQRVSAAMALLDRGIGKAGDANDTSGRSAQRAMGLAELRSVLSELERRRGDPVAIVPDLDTMTDLEVIDV